MITLYYHNINGYWSKKDSLVRIIEAEISDLIALCETKREDIGKTKNDELLGFDNIEKKKTEKRVILAHAPKENLSNLAEDFLLRKYC